MSQVLVVGDLHGRIEVVEKALEYPCDKVVFVGDYFDSYDRSVPDQVACFDRVAEAIERGRAIGLLGNHDVSYFDPVKYGTCSGFNFAVSILTMDRTQEYKKFQFYTFVEDYLITHAGVSQYLLNELNMSLQEYLDYGDYAQVGRMRGGTFPVGGLLWCHFPHEFSPIPEVNQIFGHTQGQNIRVAYNNWCVDALDDPHYPALLIEDSEAQVVYLK